MIATGDTDCPGKYPHKLARRGGLIWWKIGKQGKIFLWTKLGWFERIVGESGDVAFTPVAQSEDELRKIIARYNPSADLVPLGGNYRKIVSEEFMDQSLSYEDSAQYSEEESSEENDQQYHQHD
jgi:hypothetical protein